MPDYQQLSRDEVLRPALEKDQLTDEARLTLDAKFARRGLSNDDLRIFETEETAATVVRQKEVREVSFSFVEKKLRGRSTYSHDPRLRIEEFDTTLWVLVLDACDSFRAYAASFEIGGIYVLPIVTTCSKGSHVIWNRSSSRGSKHPPHCC